MHPALFRPFECDDKFDLALAPIGGTWRVPPPTPPPAPKVATAPQLPARATTSQAVLTVLWQRRPGAMTAQELAKLLPEELDTRAVSNALSWLFQHGYVTHPEDEVFGMPYHWSAVT